MKQLQATSILLSDKYGIREVTILFLATILFFLYLLPEEIINNPEHSICLFRNLFEIPCPGCGMTRAIYCLLHLDFNRACNFHPAVFSLMMMVILEIATLVLPISNVITKIQKINYGILLFVMSINYACKLILVYSLHHLFI